MTTKPLLTHAQVFGKYELDPEYRKAKRKVRPYYDVVRAVVKRRSELKMTQKALAQKAHMHQGQISRIEAAEHDFRLSTLIELAEALNTEVIIRLVPFSEPQYIVAEGEYKKLFETSSSIQSKSERFAKVKGGI